MKNVTTKFKGYSFFQAIVSVLLLSASAAAFSLSTQAIQNPPTYQGTLKGEAACSTTYHTTGFEPVDPSAPNAKYPLFLYFSGTSFDVNDNGSNYTTIAGQAVASAMAARGFVAVSVEYDNRFTSLFDNSYSPTGFQNKLACMFGSSNSANLTAALCARSNVNCAAGIATWGHSQGAMIALTSSNYEKRVNAAFAMGYIPFSGMPAPILPYNRIRLITAENDTGNNNTSTMSSVVGVSSQDCPGQTDQCLRADGSGWVLVRQAQLSQNQADHCWFDKTSCSANYESLEPNWTPGNAYVFSLSANANWLAGVGVQARACPSARLALQAQANNNYVSARVLTTGVPLQATSTGVADWEKFTCLEKGNGQIILQAVNGSYVYADPANSQQLFASATSANATVFQVINGGSNIISLKAVSNAKYVSADLLLAGQLIANRSSISAWEQFVAVPQ